ncbi:MAG TPA: methyl-accepting chemotaxis protein [Bryobacteraceae bacterium]|nr:methyl-accepting chemotaxis protein [Bryobacteraceae bacterium]
MSQMTVGKRLTIGFGATLAVALVLAASGIFWVGRLGSELDLTVNQTARKVQLLSQIDSDFLRMRSCQRGIQLFAMHNLPDKVAADKAEFESRMRSVEQSLRDLKPLLVTDEGKRSLAEIETELPNYQGYFRNVVAAATAGKHDDALREYTQHSFGSVELMGKAVKSIMALQQGLMDQSRKNATDDTTMSRWISVLLTLVAVLIAPFVLMSIRRTTRELRQAARELADGSDQIASAAAQVASSSGSLAQGASEQAASLEETSASAEEITSMTRKNAENSKIAAQMMAAVDQHVHEGNLTLGEMVGSMTEINASSEKISKIIKVIDEIAFQTNILALNAAVEAARAGEAGMGFAVVADEVRNLAQRSAQAAKDTAAMIEESIAKSSEGNSKLQRVTAVIRSITESATKVKTLVDEVSLGSQEQARGIEQISKAVAQMDGVTQTTAASAEQSASASEQLSAQAESLKSIVTGLQSLVGKAEGATSSSAPRSPEPKKPAYAFSPTAAPVKFAAKAPVFQQHGSTADSFPMDDNFIEQ